LSHPRRTLPSSADRGQLLSELIARVIAGSPQNPPLHLRARDLADPTLALLDAWATVGDVIGFYLDRIAEEGYAATAQEPGSVLALAAMLGQQPRLGTGATAHCAYTLQADAEDKAVLLPAGLLAQSVPGPGEQPQTFETGTPLLTRPSWSTLPVKTTAPQTVPASGPQALGELVVSGTSERIAANDVILLSLAGAEKPAVVRVAAVSVDQKARTTTVALQSQPALRADGAPAPPPTTVAAIDALTPGLSVRPPVPPRSVNALNRGPDTVFAEGSDAVPRLLASLRPELAPHLYPALRSTPIGTAAISSAGLLRVKATPFGAQAPPRKLFDDLGQPAGTEELPIEDIHALEFEISIASLAELIDRYKLGAAPRLERLHAALHQIRGDVAGRERDPVVDVRCESPLGSGERTVVIAGAPPWQADLRKLGTVELDVSDNQLKVTYTSDDERRLPGLTVTAAFDAADESVQLMVPEGEYAWDPAIRSPIRVSLGDRRLAISWPVTPGATAQSALSVRIETPLEVADRQRLVLDKVYDGILPGSHVVIDSGGAAAGESSYPVVARVVSVAQVAISRYDLTARVTELELDAPWIGHQRLLSAVRPLTVRAQPDTLAMQPVPVLDDVGGDRIELAGLVAGMEPGHLLVVTGTRSDLPAGSTVVDGEVAMVANVVQGAADDGEEPHTTFELATKLAFGYVRSSVNLYGNVVAAHQGATVREVLGSGTPSQRRQSFVLASGPLLADAATGQSTLTVMVDGVRCPRVERIDSDTPARGYVTGLDSRGHTTITFAGPLPAGNGNIVASYRAGDGSLGNLRAGQLSQLLSRPLGVTGVINPLPAAGGTAPDGPGEVREHLSARLGALGRIVTIGDYAGFARGWPGVARATARRVDDSGKEAVLVTVAGVQPVAPTQALCDSIAAAATASGELGLPVLVLPAALVTIVLVARVTRAPGHEWDVVADGVRSALVADLGYPRRALAQNLVLSELTAAAHGNPGVDAFSVTALALVPATATAGELAAKLPQLLASTAPLAPVIDVGSATAEWGDAAAVTGPRPDAIAFLDPAVPDTLMLTEAP